MRVVAAAKFFVETADPNGKVICRVCFQLIVVGILVQYPQFGVGAFVGARIFGCAVAATTSVATFSVAVTTTVSSAITATAARRQESWLTNVWFDQEVDHAGAHHFGYSGYDCHDGSHILLFFVGGNGTGGKHINQEY